MSINVQITKVFHRATIAVPLGTSIVENMTFVDMDDAQRWAEAVNGRHLDPTLPYHIINVHIDNRNFVCMDINDIWDAAGDEFLDAYNTLNPQFS